jgi:hypothetical protein
MACERYRDALSDLAAGGRAEAAVEAHLASCDACRGELVVLRQALAVADEEMGRLLRAEPSPELATRIRSAVTESGTSREWRLGWFWPSLAAAAALLIALSVVTGRAPSPEPGVARGTRSPQLAGAAGTAEPSIATAAPEPTGEPAVAVPAPRAGDPSESPRLARRRAAPSEPEVLVPPGEAEALLRLVALVHRERLAPPVLGAAGERSADLAELRPIDIEPLEIVPLDPAEGSGT